jgi:hypothetical protein
MDILRRTFMLFLKTLSRSAGFITVAALSAVTSNADEAQMHAIAEAISAARIEANITTLANFGTRHTLSETQSNTRGIGAARRWMEAEFN